MTSRVAAMQRVRIEAYAMVAPDTLADQLYNCINSLYAMPVFDECNAELLKEVAERCDTIAALGIALSAKAREKSRAQTHEGPQRTVDSETRGGAKRGA